VTAYETPDRWAETLADAQSQSVALVLGVFSLSGQMNWCNRGMEVVLSTIRSTDAPCDCFVNPTFPQLAGMPDSDGINFDGIAFEGIVTLGNRQNTCVSLNGRVYRRHGELLVVCEYDVLELARLNVDLASMNREISNLQRSLMHEKRRQEDAVANLRESNLRAEEATRTKSEFLANMSHEIRTPMTAILGFSDILAESVTLPAQQEAIQTIKRNGRHLLEIINDILDLSKIEAGKLQVEQLPTSPQAIFGDVVSLMRARAEEKHLALKLAYRGPIPQTVQTDPTRLRQILINLVGNAIKFTESGSITMAIQLADRDSAEPKLQCAIIDTGVGISPQTLDGLFQPFQQADASTTRKFGGTGLGLAISKHLAHLLGGDITVRSEPGKGSDFTLSVATGSLDGITFIDQVTEAIVRIAASSKPSTTPRVRLDGRILLADDGPDNQRLIAFVLRKAGAEVEICDNGKSAVERALSSYPGWGQRIGEKKKLFDLILMDMQMPVMDGYEATRQLRRHGYTGPILALTAHAMKDDMQKCLDAGCDDYLTKPIAREQFLARIASYLKPSLGIVS
jgi:signal transduction histidine kinase/ActR/RegA family two-component response regulator